MRNKLYQFWRLQRINIEVDVIPKLITAIQIVTVAYILLFLLVYFINRFFSIAPLEISDYVVSSNSEIVIYSDFENKFYIYDADLKSIRIFPIPSYGGGSPLAIDENNNLYLAKRRSVLKLDMQGHLQSAASASLDEPESWRLTKEDAVVHFNETTKDESIFHAMRLRRIAKPGDLLFYERDRSAVYSITDPFIDMKGNKYTCKNWLNGITVVNSSGQLKAHLRPPLLMRAFILPFPGAYFWIGGIALSALLEGVKRFRH